MTQDSLGTAKLNANGEIEFEKLSTNQILSILVNQVNTLDQRVKDLSVKVDDRLANMATRDDLARFGARMSKLETQLEDHEARISKHEIELTTKEQGLAGKLKNKAVDYVVMLLVVLVIAAIVGGIANYVSDDNDMKQLRQDIEEIRKLK